MDSTILQLLGKHNLPVTQAFIDAMREAYAAGVSSVATSPSKPGDDEDEDTHITLSVGDAASLRALGIDPSKTFLIRNSRFTICGYKPSRWKFPIVAQTQNGTRYKFTVAQIKQNQK